MRINKYMAVALLCLVEVQALLAQRKEMNIEDWQFSRDRQTWEAVKVPHDWAIAGPFDKKWDLQTVAIVQNGETVATEKSGRSGGLPWIGEGFYKTVITMPEGFEKAMLVFDGAMAEPAVKVNGQYAGYWANGYNAFRLDVTRLMKPGANTLEVDLKNVDASSRWYPGAGIYRPVKLVLTPKVHLDDWATSIRTADVAGETALVDYETIVQGVAEGLNCMVEILDAKGNVVAVKEEKVSADGSLKARIAMNDVHLWSPESPYLYEVRARIFHTVNTLGEEGLIPGKIYIDEQITNLGVRTVSITKENGFQLNGKTRKLQGVCLHHDLGPLGAAVNKAALVRQIKIMKDMGVDAIRTAHNMPSTMQMDVCDSLGMMVMAESFDMWIYPKVQNGYSRFFKEWAEKDITNLILNHRNHPSIIMWSIGNEIPEQWDKVVGVEWSRRLQDICHRLDPTRTVTQGFDRVDDALASGVAETMDVVGLNYRTHKYDKALHETTKGVILGSETASSISSRGVYKLPYKVQDMPNHPDAQCSAYDTEYCSWSNLPENDFENMDDLPYTIGQFVWTGIDYLGEPTPYDEYWPSRSSYFGICDLAGLPKDRYWLYRSVWNKREHTLHIAPHWNWGKEMIGKNVPVQVYSDYDEAELFINGKSQGRIKKHSKGANPNEVGKALYIPDLDRYRLRWMDTVYEPGELRVVAYDKHGKPAMEKTVRTAGEPDRLLLSADRKVIKADGNDLAYITVTMADKDGNPCPLAQDALEFEVSGKGSFKAACNGDATSVEPFTEPKMKLFYGQLVVTVQSTEQSGSMTLTVSKPGSKIKKSIRIKTKK